MTDFVLIRARAQRSLGVAVTFAVIAVVFAAVNGAQMLNGQAFTGATLIWVVCLSIALTAFRRGGDVAERAIDRSAPEVEATPAAPLPPAVVVPLLVHTHRPDEDRGLDCPERMLNGRLVGACQPDLFDMGVARGRS